MEYTLTLTNQQLTIIDAALSEMPYKVAQPLFKILNEQIERQDELRKKLSLEEFDNNMNQDVK